MGESLLY